MTENSQSKRQTLKLITASFFAMAITIFPITSTEIWMIRNIAAHAFKRGIISRFPHLSLRSTNLTGQQLRLKIKPVSEPVRAVSILRPKTVSDDPQWRRRTSTSAQLSRGRRVPMKRGIESETISHETRTDRQTDTHVRYPARLSWLVAGDSEPFVVVVVQRSPYFNNASPPCPLHRRWWRTRSLLEYSRSFPIRCNRLSPFLRVGNETFVGGSIFPPRRMITTMIEKDLVAVFTHLLCRLPVWV